MVQPCRCERGLQNVDDGANEEAIEALRNQLRDALAVQRRLELELATREEERSLLRVLVARLRPVLVPGASGGVLPEFGRGPPASLRAAVLELLEHIELSQASASFGAGAGRSVGSSPEMRRSRVNWTDEVVEDNPTTRVPPSQQQFPSSQHALPQQVASREPVREEPTSLRGDALVRREAGRDPRRWESTAETGEDELEFGSSSIWGNDRKHDSNQDLIDGCNVFIGGGIPLAGVPEEAPEEVLPSPQPSDQDSNGLQAWLPSGNSLQRNSRGSAAADDFDELALQAKRGAQGSQPSSSASSAAGSGATGSPRSSARPRRTNATPPQGGGATHSAVPASARRQASSGGARESGTARSSSARRRVASPRQSGGIAGDFGDVGASENKVSRRAGSPAHMCRLRPGSPRPPPGSSGRSTSAVCDGGGDVAAGTVVNDGGFISSSSLGAVPSVRSNVASTARAKVAPARPLKMDSRRGFSAIAHTPVLAGSSAANRQARLSGSSTEK
eukprot:TRINITY_DN76449_c0_g1_i1.p1 TRINITY_DN76449_c0_g1~~TRINITY_DN76449_c0_g1_i1.p1  ORF type:complete len:504 (+),score=96.72 TRINITY_DN76449_c0_g1_i1:146-1657(+)